MQKISEISFTAAARRASVLGGFRVQRVTGLRVVGSFRAC